MARSRRRQAGNKKSKDLDPSRWAHAVFAVFGLLTVWVMTHFVEDVWAFVQSIWTQLPRVDTVMAKGIGIVVGLIITIWAWRREKYFKFITEVVVEVSQITWPTRAETRAATVVVITITLICSFLLFGMDIFWGSVTDWLYEL